MPRPLAALLLALALSASACLTTPEEPLPGDVRLGAFAFRAQAVDAGTTCPRVGSVEAAFDGGVGFSGTLSRRTSDGRAFLTIAGFSRDAGFDGQVLTSTHRAVGSPDFCGTGCRGVEIEETLEVALLSPTQAEAAGGGCPVPGTTALPDGGVPPAVGEQGLDAVRACGRLVDRIIVSAGATDCTCTSCDLTQHVEGTRE